MASFDLLVAKMERAKQDHLRELNRQLFGIAASPPLYVPSKWHRWSMRWLRVRGYLRTLWAALRGDELVQPYDGDDY